VSILARNPGPPAGAAPGDEPDLTVVMPVYNEGAGVGPVLREWCGVLRQVGIEFVIALYDDGSGDETAQALAALARELPEVRLTSQANRGHGPTILRGYREARSAWIFQTDSDGEIPASEFPRLWERREEFDFILGRRTGRPQSGARKLVSRVARGMIRIAFGAGVVDVNSPCRLMRRARLTPLLEGLPETLFAPNVALSGLAVAHRLRWLELPVRFAPRTFGQGSLARWRIARVALRCGFETLAVALRARRAGRRAEG
jgi:glycosyltransferase involved in cell wall biosynthesis